MQARAACAACAALAILLACASPAQRERYRTGREALARSESASVVADADPFAGATQLSRGALIAGVLARNPGIDAARQAWRAALARYPQETALPDPLLGYGVRPRSFGSDEVDNAQDVELSQALPFPGKLGLRGDAALAAADAAGANVDAERVKLAALASGLFDAHWLASRGLESAREQRSLVDALHEAALARYAAGRGAQADVLAAETESAMLEHRELELETELRISRQRINTLLHRAPDAELPAPPRELDAAPAPAHELDADALVAQALAQRPELRALAAAVRERELSVALAHREYLPDFTLRGAYEGSWQETPLKPFVGVELNVPIQLERRAAAVDEAEAALARQRSLARRAEDRVRLDVTGAVERLREAQHLLDLSRARLLPAARDRASVVRASYSSGEATLLEVVEAERSLRAAELAEQEALAQLSERHAALARALGEVPTQEGGRP
jgi:outer membrane protein TolC